MQVVFVDKNGNFPYVLTIPDRDDDTEYHDKLLQRVIDCLKHRALSISGAKFPSEIKDMSDCKWFCYDDRVADVHKLLSMSLFADYE